MKQGLSLRASQHLALTPQLQQSIRLLQLSTLELGQEIADMLDENPFLERDDAQSEREDFGLAQADTPVRQDDLDFEFGQANVAESTYGGATADAGQTPTEALNGAADAATDWDGDGSHDLAHDDSEWGVDAQARGPQVSGDDDQDATALAHPVDNLQTFLRRQMLGLRLAAPDRAALEFLVDSLDEDGYLPDTLEALAHTFAPADDEALQGLLHHFRVALQLLHHLEPVGVGARDLAECLQLQIAAGLQESGLTPDARHVLLAAQRICQQPLELLARRDIKRLVQLGAGNDAVVRLAIAKIARLEPKPGRRFVSVERNIVVPDVLVKPLAGSSKAAAVNFHVMLNPDVLPRLKVHDVYANVLRNHRGGRDAAGHAALQQHLQEARWFIKNIQQRFDTILRVSTAIVERQKRFFTHGELGMRPLVLREIADALGLHESTISRVTTAKYMATPFGTFELKYFFGSGLGTESGGNASSTAVRALIKQFISAESARKPLSDNQISEMLKEQGIECARRTVAKYREGLKIAPTSLRKAL